MRTQTRILLGLAAGVAFGVLVRLWDIAVLRTALLAMEPVGTAWIRLITMVVVPLVIASLFVAIASVGDLRRLAGLGGRTLGFFLVTTVFAASIGLAAALLVEPGLGIDPSTGDTLTAELGSAAAGAGEAGADSPGAAAAPPSRTLGDAVISMIPRNPIAAAAQMDLLPLIVSVLIFGAAANLIAEERRQTLIGFFSGVNDLCMVVIGWVMKLAPYAVFVLIATTTVRFGTELLWRLLIYSLVVVGALAIHLAVVLAPALKFLARVDIVAFWRRVAEAPLLAFSTASSNATLPVSMKVAQQELGVSERVASFVLPAAATLNMNGGAAYKAVTAVFLAQFYGLSLDFGQQVTIVAAATIAAVAGVGVPSSSLVTTLIVLNAIGLGEQAAAGIALVAGLDGVLDRFRTSVNVVGDLTCVAYIARCEGDELLTDTDPPLAAR